LANGLNKLTNYTHHLKAWSVALSSMTDQEKFRAVYEYVDPIATVGLTLPYVIKSRFIFATAHLCHQANRASVGAKWQDDLTLDSEIYHQHADKYGSRWRAYKLLKQRLERLGDKTFQTRTHDFRHAYNHRFSPA
jgi:hypothetical protein